MTRVVIVGAGIGGLATALALRQAGIETAIFDRIRNVHDLPPGHGITLWPNATKVLDRLGALDAVRDAGAEIERMQFRDLRGRSIADHPAGEVSRELGGPTLGLRRSELHRALLDVVGEDAVQFGAECDGVDQDADGATVHFADGRSERADAVVAADGSRSPIRRLLVGDEPIPTGIAEMHGTVPTPPDVPTGAFVQTWGPGAKFGFYPVGNATCWYLTVKSSDERYVDADGRLAAIRERVAAYPPPTVSLVDAESEHPITRALTLTRDLSKPWAHGRIVLLGDAAHAMAPHLGQGAGQAIEDATVLRDCLGEAADVSAAFRNFEELRKPRVAAIAKQARILGRGLVLENSVAHTVWRNVVRYSWAPIGSKQYVNIHRYVP